MPRANLSIKVPIFLVTFSKAPDSVSFLTSSFRAASFGYSHSQITCDNSPLVPIRYNTLPTAKPKLSRTWLAYKRCA